MIVPQGGPDRAPVGLLGSPEEHAAVYAAVVESALDAVIVADETGVVVAMNPAAEATFGYGADEAVGRPIAELIVPGNLRDAHEAGMSRYRLTGEPHVLGRRVTLEARCKDGRIIPVELAITEVVLPGRRLFTANLRDLSAARSAAAEIERQRDALHQSEKLAALGSLLAGVAHELNNPLSIVLGQASILKDDIEAANVAADLSERVEKIEAAAQRCARVIRSFLAIARQRKAAKKAVAIAPLLDATIEFVMYGLRSAGIAVTRDYDAQVPDVYVDPDQVQQIVVNLLVNASQALEDVAGPRAVRVSAHAEPEGFVRVVVADNGPGVPADVAKRAFDPFFTTKAHGVGTGIGLSVSRGLAESQGGRLELIESKVGAAFAVRLPVAIESQAAAVAGRKAAAAPPAAAKRRVLIVDDETEIAGLISESLRRGGYDCDTVGNGREAQALLADQALAWHAVVCDLRMPEQDGPGLFRWIEANRPALAERVLFVTGDALGPVAGRFLADSGRPVLEKPFAPADVVLLVSSLPFE
jgi:PAS domain S-box-containing protein